MQNNPNHTITDAFGHSIQEGDKVIYNLSGEQALGIIKRAVITETRETTWSPYSQDTYLIEIECIKSTGWNEPRKHISKVRNPNGIVVLKGIMDDN